MCSENTGSDQITLLIASADPSFAGSASRHAAAQNWTVKIAPDGVSAVRDAKKHSPNLIIMDIAIPGTGGVKATRKICQSDIIPIIMLTSRDENDKIAGFTAGAEDCMSKPVSMRELFMRCKVLLRRFDRIKTKAEKKDEGNEILRFGSLVIDTLSHTVSMNGEPVHLTPTEFSLLTVFAKNPKTLFTRTKLLEEVWNWTNAKGTRTTDSHVKALRAKLGSKIIKTEHGVGYVFAPEAEEISENECENDGFDSNKIGLD